MKPVAQSPGEELILPVREFFTHEVCPETWRSFDLYLVRDGVTVFYVGQSEVAFLRVWEHIHDGLKGRSLVGRFLLCNWPAAMRYEIVLLNSQAERFAAVEHNRSAAERLLIETLAPCFNLALNPHPTPLPAGYAPPTAKPRGPRSLGKLMGEASRACEAAQRQRWLADIPPEWS